MFAGLVAFGDHQDPRDFVSKERILGQIDPMGVADKTGCWTGKDALLAQASIWNTPQSARNSGPTICPETGRVLVGWVRFDNRDELAGALGLAASAQTSDEQLALAAHRSWGADCATRLIGDFAFAIHSPDTGAVFAARDAAGARPFFYHHARDLFVFASSAAVFPALKRCSIQPSKRWIGCYILGYAFDHTRCAYEEVWRLPAAHRLTWEPGKQAPEVDRYFSFADTAPVTFERDERRVEAYREAFEQAVDDRLVSLYPVGSECSGGLDSATITARAAETLQPEGQLPIPFGFAGFEQEPIHQRLIAERYQLATTHLELPIPQEDDPTDWDLALKMLGHPPEHSNAALHAAFYRRCRGGGIRTLLSGFGGDEIVTTEAIELYDELLAAGRPWQMVRETGANWPDRIRALGRRARRRATAKNALAIQDTFLGQLERSPLSREFIEAFDLRAFQLERAESIVGNNVNARILRRGFRPHMSGRLESFSLIASAYAVDYRWPLLDRRLVECFLATPAIEKRRQGVGRYIHRRANEGRVPENVLWHGKWMGNNVSRIIRNNATQPEIDTDLDLGKIADIIDKQRFPNVTKCNNEDENSPSLGAQGIETYEARSVARTQQVLDWLHQRIDS